MSEVIDWLMFLGYAAMWFGSSIYGVRWIADNSGRCTGRSVDGTRRLMDGSRAGSGRGTCMEWHGRGCWRADGDITPSRFAAASLASLAWPALIPLLVGWSIANRKPTVVGLQHEIARLEREAGIQ